MLNSDKFACNCISACVFLYTENKLPLNNNKELYAWFIGVSFRFVASFIWAVMESSTQLPSTSTAKKFKYEYWYWKMYSSTSTFFHWKSVKTKKKVFVVRKQKPNVLGAFLTECIDLPGVPSTSTQKMVLELYSSTSIYCTRVLHHCICGILYQFIALYSAPSRLGTGLLSIKIFLLTL